MQDDVQSRIRSGRSDRPVDVGDVLDHSDGDVQGDLELALLQMRAATLIRIDEALVRLDAGKYGSCFECAGEISEQRLRALPFAVRCRTCEERREQDQTARAAARSTTRELALPGGGPFLKAGSRSRRASRAARSSRLTRSLPGFLRCGDLLTTESADLDPESRGQALDDAHRRGYRIVDIGLRYRRARSNGRTSDRRWSRARRASRRSTSSAAP